MGEIFSVSEVLQLAVRIEENGRDFYDILASKAKDERTKSMFLFLSEEEGKHIEDFRKILDEVKNSTPKEAFTDDYFAYIKSLSEKYVFTESGKGRVLAEGIDSEKEALDFAVKIERDSIDFYKNIKKSVPADSLNSLDEIISQEQGHLKKLLSID